VFEELTALAKIADIDTTALQTETELKQIPERIASLQGDVGRLEALLEAERQELAEAERLLKTAEQEISNQHDALSRSKSKSAKARNAREADAVERELEAVRRTLKDREGERDALKSAIDTRRGTLEKHEGDFAQLKSVADKEREAGEARAAELRASHEEVQAGREVLAAKLPKQIMRRYELIRGRRGFGVAIIKAGSCMGCNVALAPQLVIKVQRGEELEQCPSCQRFLCPMALRPGAAGDDGDNAGDSAGV